ncbi:MAG: PIN domain-containing protein [Bacteroidetes bacterium SW_11_45_7]|nr:MAG: PIN domain-containing protein [Bacteroidetes bacterium SW_11_45_7]
MAERMILVDTSVLIDYYRKTYKENSVWIGLVRQEYAFAISAVTKYEVYSGATQHQLDFWNRVLEEILVLPFDETCVDKAIEMNASLKQKRKQIDIADLFIAATAVNHNLTIATLNRKDFERIDELNLVAF